MVWSGAPVLWQRGANIGEVGDGGSFSFIPFEESNDGEVGVVIASVGLDKACITGVSIQDLSGPTQISWMMKEKSDGDVNWIF